MAGGRPLKYKTRKELEVLIDKYFEDCDNHKSRVYSKEAGGEIEISDPKPYTVTGLALALGMNRQGLMDYQGRKEFMDTIKLAKARCESYAEECLYKGRNSAGVIFSMKNNYGWVDRQEIDQKVEDKRKLEDFL